MGTTNMVTTTGMTRAAAYDEAVSSIPSLGPVMKIEDFYLARVFDHGLPHFLSSGELWSMGKG
jgi:hypothetical protein